METATKFCSQCGIQLAQPTPNYCPNCGTQIAPLGRTPFHTFRARWLLLVFPLAMVVGILVSGDLGTYATDLILGGWVALVVLKSKISIPRLLGRIPSGFNWWPILLLAVASVVFSVGAFPILWYPIASAEPDFVADMLSAPVAGSQLDFFILIVVIAPLVEESLFRGLLFSRLTAKWSMTRAMVVSSIAFGLLHLNPIGASVFGVVACVLYVRTQTLLVPMALHSLNNFLVWLASFGETDAGVPYDSSEFLYQGLVAMLLAAPIIFILLGKWWPARGTLLPYMRNREEQQHG